MRPNAHANNAVWILTEVLSEMVNSSSLVRSKVKNRIAQPLEVPLILNADSLLASPNKNA